jgi:threonine/homoserine/homoserine lactone efflux protein
MMTPSALPLFAGTEFVWSLTPGPAVLLVMSQALRVDANASVLGALRMIAGNAVYLTISASGTGVSARRSVTIGGVFAPVTPEDGGNQRARTVRSCASVNGLLM